MKRARTGSRKPAPAAGERDSALELAKRAVPKKLHAGAVAKKPAHADLAPDKDGHPLTEHLLKKHAATLREAKPGDADVLFAERGSSQGPLVVQVRRGRVARVLTRA